MAFRKRRPPDGASANLSKPGSVPQALANEAKKTRKSTRKRVSSSVSGDRESRRHLIGKRGLMPLTEALFAPLVKQLDNTAKSNNTRCDGGVQGFNSVIHRNGAQRVNVFTADL